ncbi:MAG: 3-isopropylmalate dehydrogenase [Bacteroidales bacterium]
MRKSIALLPGDGIGPEIIKATRVVLNAIEEKYGHTFSYTEGLIGGVAIDNNGNPFPEETQSLCMQSDAILFGAIGNPKYDNNPKAKVRPEQGLLKMRRALGLFANIRPIISYPQLMEKSPLKNHLLKDVDFVVVRELTGGIYFGEPRGRSEDGLSAFDTCVYSKEEIEKVANVAFNTARNRKKKITMVDKANVLATSRLWREVVGNMAKDNSDITVEYMFVDNAAMQIIQNPASFDVILTENMFGDILTDEASIITGSLGMIPSASHGVQKSLYEPIHGSYPQAAGKNIANPIATILSSAMMLESSFNLNDEAMCIRLAVNRAVTEGATTSDISNRIGFGTIETANAIRNFILE